MKKVLLNGKGEVFLNATDLFNTMVIKKEIQGVDFSYVSTDYYETQVIRLGFNYKFWGRKGSGIILFFRHEDIVRIFNLATKNINDQN